MFYCIISVKISIMFNGELSVEVRSPYVFKKMNKSHFFVKKLLTNKIFCVIIAKMTDSHFVKRG